ncbi:hypothetical protein ACOM2C_19495 [Pseudarthrobacter sp. So.54]
MSRTAPHRTVKNISTELHATLSTPGVDDSYALIAHSLAGIDSLDYVNRFPGEVSALVTIGRGLLRAGPRTDPADDDPQLCRPGAHR